MVQDSKLFTPLDIKGLEFKNRIWVSPMCQYSSKNGHPTDWHFVHLGSRAVGGAGLVMVEATAVSPEGRISPDDSGIWSDEHIPGFLRLSEFIKSQNAVAGIQIAHAGRKASTSAPWLGNRFLSPDEGGWDTVAPSSIPFQVTDKAPREMTMDDIDQVREDFVSAAGRCLAAGFQVLELHMAHGYLLHEFLSPLANHRKDKYGGSLENRMRFPLEITRAVREVWPRELPLFVRISATDWVRDDEWNLVSDNRSWDLASSITFSRALKAAGIDLIDCSSGGMLANASIPVTPGYQVPFADIIRKEAQIMTAAVGLITEPQQAESILASGQADAIFMARELLRNPYWPLQTARAFEVKTDKPRQYGRA